ncbi:hypothetical protein N7G274_010460 [Stereocaulon virgatum]|uniref:Capsule polysaccharide biosynthesis protein n=1 Tax=Stereocaulon virgatum TaxID=373712 RepID=A0ABR3ZTI5_9LECA
MTLHINLTPLRRQLGFAGRAGLWKFLALIFALLNLKNLPFAWHIRLLKGLLTHIRSSRLRLASQLGPSALFQPLITSSRSGFLECDYNLHKSNSTYFSDFDVGRLELLVSLCGYGIDQTRKDLAKEGNERFATALGGVSCNFRKEIKPYEGFEVWTRILSWDNKWLYVISHFVKKGAVRPKAYTLQPWRRSRTSKAGSNGHAIDGDNGKEGPHPAIFASGIAKYVFKKGRRTIPPERVLRASRLLPLKPAEHESPPVSMTPNPETTTADTTAASTDATLTHSDAGEFMAASLDASFSELNNWSWEKVEEERRRGMKVAEIYNRLDALNGEFTGEGDLVLGQY